MIRGPLGPGSIVLGGGAFLLFGFLGIGALLPTEWAAEAAATIPATTDQLLPLIDSPEGWRQWTTWPDSGLARSGPERGPGASIAWDDPELGSGSFTITEPGAEADVAYAVEVAGAGGGSMSTVGTISLGDAVGGTRVVWREEGDLGRNPLMGYWARSMRRAQSAEMEKGLDRLACAATPGCEPSR